MENIGYKVLVSYGEVLARDRREYSLCTGESIGNVQGGVGVTGGERIAGEVICEVAVGKKYKSRKTYNCEVAERETALSLFSQCSSGNLTAMLDQLAKKKMHDHEIEYLKL